MRDAVATTPVAGALITIDNGRQGATTDAAGAYRIREVRSGWHTLRAVRIGFRPVQIDSVLVRSGETVTLDLRLDAHPTAIDSIVVNAARDKVLDPMVPQDLQRITAPEIRLLPVTTLEEAVALSAGAVGESYRGGRLGESAFILDGLGVKNQLDASTGSLGLRIPPEILTEASLVTNAFSARYGQALSGVVNVVTKDPGDRWTGRTAYESDRLMPRSADHGLDRALLTIDGPLGAHGIGFLGVLNAEGRIDADPVNAPAPTDPRDPRSAEPWVLPHNSGERLDGAGKLLVPVDQRNIVRLFGMYSVEQRLLYDPAYKYDLTFAPASRVRADLFTAQLQHTAAPESQHPLNADLRVGYFDRAFVRGALSQQPVERFGGFTGQRFHFLSEGIAERQDTVAARAALPGFTVPQLSEHTPWGVPAFFLGDAPRGEIAWNHFRELRSQLDVTLAGGPSTDFYLGGEFAQQHVNTFQRVFAYQPVDSTIPPPTASTFAPQSAALYAEMQTRAEDIAVTFGLRYDQFDPHTQTVGQQFGARRAISPRLAVSTVLKGATVVASWGRFAQAPDFQYLVDAAFDDTLRTGRFRRGNPDLGFEDATQYEFSVRARPSPVTSVRVNGYIKRLDGLVASVPIGINPDSAIFANGDFGSVKGAELIVEREMRDWWGARVSYAFMNAEATSTSPFLILQNISIGPTGDTIRPARVQFPLDYDRHHSLTVVLQARAPDAFGPRVAGVAPLAAWELAVIGHYNSGLPYTRTNLTGDTLVGLPNSFRLPPQTIIDMRLRRPLTLGGWRGSVYFDARNLLNARNLQSVRRETGTPGATAGEIQALAQAAYTAHPEAIPYESPRYRAWADLNHDGVISGSAELMPLYLAAARDFTQPIFAYGPPRLIRLGVELEF